MLDPVFPPLLLLLSLLLSTQLLSRADETHKDQPTCS
jgi:hypothetical protein